jgi:hypothetical protein
MGLNNFPFVELKVDREFIVGCADDRACVLSAFAIRQAVNDWRFFYAQHGHVEIAINLPISFFQDPASVERLCRQRPTHPAFAGLIVEIDSIEVIGNLDLLKGVAAELQSGQFANASSNLPTVMALGRLQKVLKPEPTFSRCEKWGSISHKAFCWVNPCHLESSHEPCWAGQWP